MEINTTRFGTVSIDEEQIITFSEGLPGFESARRFVFLSHPTDGIANGDSPFRWMQCADNTAGAASLAFPVVIPWLIDPEYAPTVPGMALRELKIDDIERQTQLWAIVTIPHNHPEQATVNLLAPLLINAETRQGCQVVLLGDDYSLRTPLRAAGNPGSKHRGCDEPKTIKAPAKRPTRGLAVAAG